MWTVWINLDLAGAIVKQTTVMTSGDQTISTSTDELTVFQMAK